jgi:hypothetical protein
MIKCLTSVYSVVARRVTVASRHPTNWQLTRCLPHQTSKPVDADRRKIIRYPRVPCGIGVTGAWHSHRFVGSETRRDQRTALWWAWEAHDFSRGRMSPGRTDAFGTADPARDLFFLSTKPPATDRPGTTRDKNGESSKSTRVLTTRIDSRRRLLGAIGSITGQSALPAVEERSPRRTTSRRRRRCPRRPASVSPTCCRTPPNVDVYVDDSAVLEDVPFDLLVTQDTETTSE